VIYLKFSRHAATFSLTINHSPLSITSHFRLPAPVIGHRSSVIKPFSLSTKILSQRRNDATLIFPSRSPSTLKVLYFVNVRYSNPIFQKILILLDYFHTLKDCKTFKEDFSFRPPTSDLRLTSSVIPNKVRNLINNSALTSDSYRNNHYFRLPASDFRLRSSVIRHQALSPFN